MAFKGEFRQWENVPGEVTNTEDAGQISGSLAMCLLPSLGFEAERASVFRNSTLDLIRRTLWKV
jgi:hypothetical protein